MDLQIDLATGDLVLSKGDLSAVEGSDAVGQRIRHRLRLFVGEWFLDLEAGLPYREQILVKNPNLSAISAILKEQILDAAGEGTRLTAFDLRLDNVNRTLFAQYELTLAEGTAVTQALTLP